MYHIKRLDQRIIQIIIFILLAFFIIISRLFYLQITKADHYHVRGQKNFLRKETIRSRRGNICDCNGALLATNRPVTNLYWQGTGNRTLTPAQEYVLGQLEAIITKPIISDTTMMRQITHQEKYYKRILLASDLSFQQLGKIEEQFASNRNIDLAVHFERHYPYRNCASHVLGYLGKHVDTQLLGKMGLEKLCEPVLKGDPGTLLKTINSVGRDIKSVTIKEALPGENLYTTIDLSIQKMCEEAFPLDRAGAFVIMDPDSGAIKALVSRPDFDPTLFLSPISPDLWKELQEKKPFINRAFNSYPPGSIFKLITISAALEKEIISPHQKWYCRGFTSFANRNYWCHYHWGHGRIDITQALAQSCNTLFFEIGKKIDIDTIADYAYRFGLGKPTNILFPEGVGIVPSRAWKLQNRGEPWWPGETLSVTIGQSFLMATPIQIARMIAGIFTGYLVKPRFLLKEEIEKYPLTLKKDTMQLLQESMRFVVTTGTGKGLNTVRDMQIHAKTSTAQTADLEKREISEQFFEHAWFVGHFKYKNHKPLVFVTLVERAGTSKVPVGITKNFLIAYKKSIDATA